MNIVKLSLRQLAARPLHTGLNVLLLSLGIATITLLMLFNAQMQDRLLSTAKGIDLVVGAKGSPLQLILSTVYHADIPPGNIPQKDADKLAKHPLVETAIPCRWATTCWGTASSAPRPTTRPCMAANWRPASCGRYPWKPPSAPTPPAMPGSRSATSLPARTA